MKPLADRLGDRRFETGGEWKKSLAGDIRGTVEILVRELHYALRR
jgi:hypothetical protein